MSYILEALKRAESERHRGEVPGLHAQPAVAHAVAGEGAGTGRWWMAGAAAAAVTALAVAGGWWWAQPAADAPREREGGLPSAPTAAPLPRVPASTTAPASVETPAQAPAQTTEQIATPTPASAPTSAVVSSPAQGLTVESVPVAVPNPVPLVAASSPVPASVAGVARATKAPIRQMDAVERKAGVAPAAVSPAEERVHTVAELPDDIRRQLPALTVAGATYSESPASRMLLINGQLYHEGDKLAPELTLQQIQLRRAVLSFRGYRYSVSY